MAFSNQIIANPSSIPVKHRSISSSRNMLRSLRGLSLQRFSRFYAVRRGYSLLQYTLQKGDRLFDRTQEEQEQCSSLFDGFSVEDTVQQMRQNSVAFGLQLSPEMTGNIHDYAVNNFCFEPKYEGQFRIGDLVDGYLNERPVFRALVKDLSRCQPIQQLANDPILLKIASSYLGYHPTTISQHLTFSVASKLPIAEVQKHYPPTSFHYDIAGYNFVTCYFYITDVDRNSGPHVMIPNTHRNKPLSLLLGPGRHSDETIYKHYSRDREIAIVGNAGYGFFQDPSCLHKVVPPSTQHRLLLQFRYS